MGKLVLGETIASVSDSAELSDTLPAPGLGAGAAFPEVPPDRFELAGEVGRGGMGRVVSARDGVLGRTIAIKELRADDEATRRRFVREALITARLQHPSIVPIYEAGRRDGAPFYAMKLVNGRTFGAAIAAAATLAERLALVPNLLAVADAIAYAHGQRIVHRDLKPQNVLLGDFGETVVIDWGLAKHLDDDLPDERTGARSADRGDHTVAGVILGTPSYMAPEQAQAGVVGEPADVYALGAMLYHVIAGTSPHRGETSEEMIERLVHGDIVPLAKCEPHAPDELATIVGKAMSLDPAQRYPSARELADDLRRFLTGQLVAAHTYSFGERLWRWVRRYRVWVVVAVALITLVAYGAWSLRALVAERDVAAENHNRTILAQARTALARDPAEALAWLRQLDPHGGGADVARSLASQAMLHVLPDLAIPGGPRAGTLNVVRGLALQRNLASLRVVELATGRARSYHIATDGSFQLCADGTHVLGDGQLDGTSSVYTLDLVTGDVVRAAEGPEATLRAWSACLPSVAADVIAAKESLVCADGVHVVTRENGVITRYARGREPERAPGLYYGVSFSADCGVVVAVRSSQVHAYDFAKHASFELTERAGSHAVVAEDGRWVAVAMDDAVLAVEIGGSSARRLPFIADALAVSHDGKWLLARRHDEVVVWQLAAPVPIRIESGSRIVDADFDGASVVTTDVVGTLRRWPLTPRPATASAVQAAAQSKDGRVRVRATSTHLTRTFADGRTESIAIPTEAREEPRVAVSDAGEVALFGVQSHWTWKPDGKLVSLPYEGFTIPDPTRLAFVHQELAVWDGKALTVSRGGAPRVIAPDWTESAGIAEQQADLTISPDERWAALTGVHQTPVMLFDLERGTVAQLPGSTASRVAFSADSRSLVTGSAAGDLIAWETATRAPAMLPVTGMRVPYLTFSDDGTRLAAIADDEVVIASMPATPATVAHHPLSTEPTSAVVLGARWSRDAQQLAIMTADSVESKVAYTVHLLDARTGESTSLPIDALAIDIVDGELSATTRYGSVSLESHVPRGLDELRAWLDALPYRIDGAHHLSTVE